ncbi:hypothetical protein F2Q69_00010395 [Brassica cretica]|uniref:Uncharacterized protein n=1 Tax=Brassica cretica TaxID=69181 RepID=A0A8S9QXQ3_BRACR|nr:hypothetical protein F2Q69_00010395 [Brassica cretica]
MFRLHFAYMSPYQVLEYHMEYLEAFGAQKGVFRVVIGRARDESDQSGATPPSRSDHQSGATSLERQGRVARVLITRRQRIRSDLSQRHSEVAPESGE